MSCIIAKVDHRCVIVLPNNQTKVENHSRLVNYTHMMIRRTRRVLSFFQAGFLEQNLLWVLKRGHPFVIQQTVPLHVNSKTVKFFKDFAVGIGPNNKV